MIECMRNESCLIVPIQEVELSKVQDFTYFTLSLKIKRKGSIIGPTIHVQISVSNHSPKEKVERTRGESGL